MPTSVTDRGTRPASWRCSRSPGASITSPEPATLHAPERQRVALPMRFGRARIEYQPLGVVGIIAPWNYPVSLALMPLATALAAGNRAMIKPSEFTPATSDVAGGADRRDFPADQVAVVTGDAAVGAAFAALPFDHLSSPGSTAVGRAVMRAAGENLVPVTLELGGKSPVIVDGGSRSSASRQSIAYGKLANAGQTCIAPDYVLLAEERGRRRSSRRGAGRGGALSEGAGERATTPRSSTRATTSGCAGCSTTRGEGRARPRDRTVARAREGVAPTRCRPRSSSTSHDDMRIMQEEIFGPVLPDRHLSRSGRGDRLRQRSPAAARALLLRQRPGRIARRC